MAITYDPKRRADAPPERGLVFEDAALVFAGPYFEVEDIRKEFGERRFICPRAIGGDWLHAAWRGSPCLQHEGSQ
jgi:uncharacterized DUF497 family protein